MIISHPQPTIQLQRLLLACIYAALLCALLGVATDTRAQSKEDVCAALNLNTANCNQITDISTTPPTGLTFPEGGSAITVTTVSWFVSPVSIEGATSLRSGDIEHNQASCLVLTLAPTPRSDQTPSIDDRISFLLRTSSQGSFDRLVVTVNSQTAIRNFSAPEGDSVRDWQQRNFGIINNIVRKLSWCYVKNSSGIDGDDSGWLDDLSFEPVFSRSFICEHLDMSREDCIKIGGGGGVTRLPRGLELPQEGTSATVATAVPWRTSNVASEGISSLQSGAVSDTQSSCLVLGVGLSGIARVNFTLRTSSEGRSDRLAFFIDDQTVLRNFSAPAGSTAREWEQHSFPITKDNIELIWCYLKNGGTSRGEDSGWLDELSFTPTSPVCSILDMSREECALITATRYEPSGSPWSASTTATEGTRSLRSPNLNDSQQSCLVLNVSLPDRTLVQFSRRVSSQPADELYFSVDDVRQEYRLRPAATTVLRDWSREVQLVESGNKVLRWCYVKDASGTEGDDRAWIDDLSLIAPPAAPLNRELVCLVLDMTAADCALINSVAADPSGSPWSASTTATEGANSLRSPNLNHDQQSCLVLNVSLPDQTLVQFSRRVSSQPADELYFSVDDVRQEYRLRPAATTVLRDWSREVHILSESGDKTLRWCYDKDSSGTEGDDRAWIDDLSLVAPSAPLNREQLCLVLDLSADHCALIDSVAAAPPELPWVLSSTATEGNQSLRSGDIGNSQTSCLVLGITLPDDRGLRFSLRTNSEAVNDFLYFEVDGTRLLDRFSAPQGSTLRDWEPQQFLLPVGNSTLRWCYTKNDSTSSGADSGWLDALSYVSAGLVRIESFCEALDLSQAQCAIIRAVTYNPPQTLWLSTATESARGGSALVSPAPGSGESSCLTVEFHSPLTPDSPVTFDWRTTSPSAQDILQFQVGAQQSQITNMPEWQTQTVMIDSAETTMGWCYNQNSAADGQTTRAWLDNLSVLTLTDRYAVQIAVISTSVLLTEDSNSFQFQVAVTAVSETLPPPTDWILIIAGIDNISAADTTYALVFADGSALQIDAIATFADPLLPSSILLSLEDRPSLLNTTGTSLAVQFPAARRLETLEIITSTSVTQSTPDAAIVIAVTVSATDNLGDRFEPAGLTLIVEDSGNAEVSQSDYQLTFVDGSAAATITVELTRRGTVGRIELSVASGDIQSAVSITLNPTPRVLASITLSAASSKLAQTTANTTVAAVLMLAALDNYGDPIEAGEIDLQIESTNDAVVVSSLTVAIATTATALQMVEILPQNDLDTTVTVSILRGSLDESVQLLPDGGIQIAVRALRVLRQLQLGLADRVSPLRQINSARPIRANIRLTGLDQYGQPIIFPEVMLTIAAVPMETTATLNPQQLTATEPEGAVTELEVIFPDPDDNPKATMITISIIDSGAGVTTNTLLVQALPDLMDALRPLHVDATETGVTELDLIVAMRWLNDPQGSTASLVVNLTIPVTDITAAGIENLRQLFTEDIDRIDVNRDGRADQLDLRILLRYLSGLRGTELAEQEVFEDLIRQLLDRQP